MKKSLLSILTLALVAVGCQNYDDQFDSLNASIASLTTKVTGLEAGVAAQVSAVSTSVANVAAQVTALASSALSAADLTASLAGVLTDLAAANAALTALDTQVASDIAGVNTNVAALTTQLTAVQTSALTAADVAALDEVTNLNAEMQAVQASLDELLTASASVNGISISNQATLDYTETLVQTDGTPESYIVNGDVSIVAASATGYDAGYIAAISAITARLSSVLGTVTITTAATDTSTLDIAKLTYVSGDLSISGKMPTGFAVSTAASLALTVHEADISLPTLTSAAGGVRINPSATVTITNVAIVNLTNGAVTTGAAALVLPNANVDLGAGHPAVTTTTKNLTAGNATDVLTGATLTISGTLALASKVVTDTSIDATGDVTLSNGTASSISSSTVISGGNMSISALTIGSAGSHTVTLTTDGLGGGTITLGATSAVSSITATTSGTTISAASLVTNGTGAVLTLNGTAVVLTALATNTGNLVVSTATTLSLPALANSAGTIVGAAVTTLSAPLLTTTGDINVAALANVTLGNLALIADVTVGDIGVLTLAAQDADLDLSTFTTMTSLTYTGKADTNMAAQDNALLVNQGNVSLTTIAMGSGNVMESFTSYGSPMTSLTTAGKIRGFTVTGTALTSLNIGHAHVQPGAVATAIISNTGILTVNLSTISKIGTVNITGNTSLTTVTAPGTGDLPEPGAPITAVVSGNKIAGVWTDAIAETNTTSYVAGYLTGDGLPGFSTWLSALVSQTGRVAGTVTYSLMIDTAVASMTANNAVSLELDADTHQTISIAAELSLLGS